MGQTRDNVKIIFHDLFTAICIIEGKNSWMVRLFRAPYTFFQGQKIPFFSYKSSASLRDSALVIAGFVFGIAQTMVNPPARAALVPVTMSSLWQPPGSRKWTWTSMRPGSLIVLVFEMQSMIDLIGGFCKPQAFRDWTRSLAFLTLVIRGTE